MKKPRRRSRVAASTGLIFAIVAAFALTLPHRASAAPAPYAGKAGTDLFHLLSLNVPDTFQLEDIGIAPATAEMSRSGLPGGMNAHAHASNLSASVLSGAIETEQLVTADHKAPGAEKVPTRTRC